MLAHTLAVVEFLVEWYFFPAKTNSSVASVCLVVGIAMISVGHWLRIGAMFTAARNFNHEVQFQKAKGHQWHEANSSSNEATVLCHLRK